MRNVSQRPPRIFTAYFRDINYHSMLSLIWHILHKRIVCGVDNKLWFNSSMALSCCQFFIWFALYRYRSCRDYLSLFFFLNTVEAKFKLGLICFPIQKWENCLNLEIYGKYISSKKKVSKMWCMKWKLNFDSNETFWYHIWPFYINSATRPCTKSLTLFLNGSKMCLYKVWIMNSEALYMYIKARKSLSLIYEIVGKVN